MKQYIYLKPISKLIFSCARPELVEGFSSSAQGYPLFPNFHFVPIGVPIERNRRWGQTSSGRARGGNLIFFNFRDNLKLLITAHFLITASCTAMENTAQITKPNILAELTCIKEPFNALYLAENRILINGRDHCSVVDPTTNKEIKRIFDHNGWSSKISVHPNRTKFAFSGYYGARDNEQQKITIYNTKTYEIEHTINCDGATINSLLFSPSDDTIAANEYGVVVTLYNYKTNKTTIIDIKEAARERGDYEPIFSFHPTQPLICLAWKNIYIHNLKTSETTAKYGGSAYHSFCEHSPDGSFIAEGTNSKIIIMKHNQDTGIIDVIKQDFVSYFDKIAFHPNNKILITLSNPGGFLNYWDVSTFQHITTMIPICSINSWAPSLSFSPNGTKLLLVLDGKCMVLEVPFDVLYRPSAKQKALFAYWLLKNYRIDQHNILLDEIAQLIMYTLLETYKR